MRIEDLYKIWKESSGISTDSRTDNTGKLFFALSGDNFNGNKFASMAIEKGAKVAIIDDESYCQNEKFIVVENTLKALQQLAHHHRKLTNPKVLGITGSNGKTTTKELISTVLKSEKKIIATKGNFNNHIGVPLTLLQIKQDTEIAVVEMGANHPGEIAELCKIAEPNYGLITNIGKAHLEGFGNLEGVIKTKNELYESIKKNGGLVLVNSDDELLLKLASKIDSFKYGTKQADIKYDISSSNPFIKINWSFKEEENAVKSNLYGSYNAINIAAAIACGKFFGISSLAINNAIENYIPANNRSQLIKTERNDIILDAYNANPVSMENAVKSFKDYNAKNPVLILGDMFELGEESLKEHNSIIKLVGKLGFENVIFTGNEFYENKNDNYIFLRTTENLIDYLKSNPLNLKTILIKGSRGMKLESVLDLL